MIRFVVLALIAAPAFADYGAIAYHPETGAWGWSTNYSTQLDAERRALRECGEKGCRIATWFRNSCGALAIGDGTGWGADWGDTISQAESNAMDQCWSYGNTNCQVEISRCSD